MSADERAVKKPKRTYRACYPCRSRKLKCSFGDPNKPWDGPCERCLRESRDCVRAQPTFVRQPVPRKTDQKRKLGEGSSSSTPVPVTFAARQSPAELRWQSPSRENGVYGEDDIAIGDDASSDEDEGRVGDDALVSASLQNPRDALRLLANASSLKYRRLETRPEGERHGSTYNTSTWEAWGPIRQQLVTTREARDLFAFFQYKMAPLYPLLHAKLYEPGYLDTLVGSESLLLGTVLAIAARYSDILPEHRGHALHKELAHWVRQRLSQVMDGDPAYHSIGTVEALLLLSEWPMLPLSNPNDVDDSTAEEARLLKSSLRYDVYSWGTVGWAVRLAQELGIHDVVNLSTARKQALSTWKQERMLKTWVYCYNADRHISVRLGRNAVLQEPMTSRWWEQVSGFVNNNDPRASGTKSEVFLLACLAQLIGTVQEHLYSHKDVTRSLLRTGTWESFLRRLRLEIRHSKRECQAKLNDGTAESALLKIEFDYVVLYANSLTLRALQERLRRLQQLNDPHYQTPSLLNMIEGQWIMEALSAARSIVETALKMLEHRNLLKYCPSRIFQYILFATTFVYKALATGMVECGDQAIVPMVEKLVDALSRAAIDEQHFLWGFAELLKRLGKHWRKTRQLPAHIVQQDRPPTAPAPQPLSLADLPPIQPPLPTVSPQGMADFGWNFDPSFHLPAVEHEQDLDLLFETIWNAGDEATGSSNLYATLLGDVLAFPDS